MFYIYACRGGSRGDKGARVKRKALPAPMPLNDILDGEVQEETPRAEAAAPEEEVQEQAEDVEGPEEVVKPVRDGFSTWTDEATGRQWGHNDSQPGQWGWLVEEEF